MNNALRSAKAAQAEFALLLHLARGLRNLRIRRLPGGLGNGRQARRGRRGAGLGGAEALTSGPVSSTVTPGFGAPCDFRGATLVVNFLWRATSSATRAFWSHTFWSSSRELRMSSVLAVSTLMDASAVATCVFAASSAPTPSALAPNNCALASARPLISCSRFFNRNGNAWLIQSQFGLMRAK